MTVALDLIKLFTSNLNSVFTVSNINKPVATVSIEWHIEGKIDPFILTNTRINLSTDPFCSWYLKYENALSFVDDPQPGKMLNVFVNNL